MKNMKKALGRAASASILAAAAAAALLAPAEEAAARGVTAAVGWTFTTLDPWDASDAVSRAAAKSFYEGLYSLDKNMKIQPQLADSYEMSPDGLTYTFKLKEGVKFHDGTEFDAEAVKANFDRILDPKSTVSRRSVFLFIDKVEPVSKYVVRFRLKSPTASFIAKLANGTAQMICPSAIKKLGSKGLALQACGTGPYTLKQFNPSEIIYAVKNPNYRVPGLPKLDFIRWVPVPENSTRASMVMTGEADYVHFMPPELMKRVSEHPNVQVFAIPSIINRFLTINTMQKPFDDVRVRKAISYAINREALCKVVYGGYSQPARGVIPPAIEGYVDFGMWPYDPKKARELLKEAGYPNGFKTEIWSAFASSTNAKALQFLQQQLRQVGIDCETRQMESGQRVSLVNAAPDPKTAPVRLYIIGWTNSTVEPDWSLRPLYHSEAMPPRLNNTSYYSNPKVDKLLDDALAETDAQKRKAMYAEVQKIVWDDQPTAFLTVEENLAAANKHLKEFNPIAESTFEFYNAYWDDEAK